MSDNVIMFPNISDKKFIDLKKASILTGLGYPLLYKLIVLQGEIGYYKFNKKIIVDTSDVQKLMDKHFVAEKRFYNDSKKKNN